MTIDEMKMLREQQQYLQAALIKNKNSFNELLELAPFAIAGGKMAAIKQQLAHEMGNSALSQGILQDKFATLRERLAEGSGVLGLNDTQRSGLLELIRLTLLPKELSGTRTLLDFSSEQQNRFLAIFDNLKDAYNKHFRLLIADQKRLQSSHYQVQKKLHDAESKEKDSVVSAIRRTKVQVDGEIKQLENELLQLAAKITLLQQENQAISRQISELAKKVKVEDADQEKDEAAAQLIIKLDRFITKLKEQKKASLETNILHELNRLMHKNDFVSAVTVTIFGDLIDIDLYDQNQQVIDKELLSKGEQQLYATAILTALIQESNIHFPVFIDSPLQKFDKQHSRNIIKEFYPHIAEQVVLFPLLQKELNEEEYQWLMPQVGKAYLIRQSSKYQSSFREVNPAELFDQYQPSHVQ